MLSNPCRTPSPTRARSPSPRRRVFGANRSRSPEKSLDDTDAGDRPVSPSRRFSPTKSLDLSGEIDPETVRQALRDFAQSMKDAERTKEEALNRANGLQKTIGEMEEERARMDQRLQTMQRTLGEAEEGEAIHDVVVVVIIVVVDVIVVVIDVDVLRLRCRCRLFDSLGQAEEGEAIHDVVVVIVVVDDDVVVVDDVDVLRLRLRLRLRCRLFDSLGQSPLSKHYPSVNTH